MTPVQAALYYLYTQPLIDFREFGGGGESLCESMNEANPTHASKTCWFSDRICALHLGAPGALEIFISLKSVIYPLYYDDICT